MLYDTVLVSDMTHFCIKRRIFRIRIFFDRTKIIVKWGQVLRFGVICRKETCLVFKT